MFNNTRVLPARLFGNEDSNSKVEIVIERILDKNHVLVYVRANQAPKSGTTVKLEHKQNATVLARKNDPLFPRTPNLVALLYQTAHIPLPPSIKRPAVDIVQSVIKLFMV